MEKLIFLLIVFLISVLSINVISAVCEDGQIDINQASLEDLDKLSGIGPAKAQEIINSRPISSIDSLIDVKGIGEVTLSNIKTQGLACVENEEDAEKEEEIEEEDSFENETELGTEENNEVVEQSIVNNLSNQQESELQTIDLNPKVIKTEEPKNLKKNVAVWGFGVFCVLIAVLFIIKKKKYKNEFR